MWLFTGDFSPSTIWDNDIYSALPNNFNLSVPMYMTADFVKEMNACAKLIVMMRDPVQRFVYKTQVYCNKIPHSLAISSQTTTLI